MTNNLSKPDKIWLDYTPYTETYEYVSRDDPHDGSTEYLLSTPERELASELVEALRICRKLVTGIAEFNRREDVAYIDAVLAKLEAKDET